MLLSELKRFSETLNPKLKSLYLENGLEIRSIKATTNEQTGEIKYVITAYDTNMKDEEGEATNEYAILYRQVAALYQLPPDGVGKTFRFNGKEYTIVGIKNTRSGKDLIARNSNGTNYKFSPDTVRAMLQLDKVSR